MPGAKAITEERAMRVARAYACSHCLEYSFKKLTVKRAPTSHQKALNAVWIAVRTCGVCGLEQEIGIDASGEVVYGG